MKHNLRKQFSSFITPIRTFLNAKLATMDDFVVVVRLTPKITILNYTEGIGYLITFFCYTFLIALQLLSIVLNVPFSALIRFVLLNGQWLVSPLLDVSIPPAHRLGVFSLCLLIGFFFAMVWIAFQARRAFREFRGFLQLRRMTPQERSSFALQRFLRVSSPAWLSASITYEPTLEELEAILHEHERALTSRR